MIMLPLMGSQLPLRLTMKIQFVPANVPGVAADPPVDVPLLPAVTFPLEARNIEDSQIA